MVMCNKCGLPIMCGICGCPSKKLGCKECDRLRAGLVDADTLRRAEIESRNREIALLRTELAAAKVMVIYKEQNERLRALCKEAGDRKSVV